MSNTDILNKTWTLSDSEENLSSEEMPSKSSATTKPTNKAQNAMNETHFIDSTSPEFLLNNLSLAANQTKNIDVSMRSFASFTTSPRSTTFSVKPDEPSHVDFRSLGTQDFNRHSVDIENFWAKIRSVNMLSLLDENFSGFYFDNGEPILAKSQTANLNETQNLDKSVNLNLTHNLNKTTNVSPKRKYTLNKNNLTVNLSPNITQHHSEIADQLLPLGAHLDRDKIPAPNSFDTFVDDLKKSTSEVIALDSPIDFSINNERSAFNLLNPSLKTMTSSVDKDLNKAVIESSKEIFKSRINRNNNYTNLVTNKNLTSSNFDLDEIQETSSPFRQIAQKQSLNSSYTIEKKSLDFGDAKAQNNNRKSSQSIPKRNKFDSNESLNDNDETSSKSSSSNHDPVESNFPFQQFDNDLEGQFLANQTADLLDDEPRTVFNQTYTSWATNDEQLQRDAARQFRGAEISFNKANTTQNIDVEDAKANLNRTMDIINDDDLMDDNDPVTENLNRTREINDADDVDTANESTIAPIETRPHKSESKSTKRLSLISSNGFVLPVVEDTTPTAPKQPATSPPKVTKVTKVTNMPPPAPAPAPATTNPQFEFKKPAIPRLSPPKVSTKLPTAPKTSIPKASFSFQPPAPSKTLSVNNSTSNILKPSSTQIPATMSNSTERLKMRSSMIASARLAPATEATKENNGQQMRMSLYASRPAAVSQSTNGALIRQQVNTQVSKSVKVSSPTASKMAPPTLTTQQQQPAPSKLAMPTKISSMIPSFKTSSLPVSKIATITSKLPKKQS